MRVLSFAFPHSLLVRRSCLRPALGLAWISLLVLALVSCGKFGHDDYRAVIPADASLVMEVDANTLSVLSEDRMEELRFFMKGRGAERLLACLDSPEDTGLDFGSPVCVFRQGRLWGLVARVSDRAQVSDFFSLMQRQGMATRPVERDGVVCGMLLGSAHYSFDEVSLLVLVPTSGSVATGVLRRHALALHGQDAGFCPPEQYTALRDEGHDIVCCASMDALPDDFTSLYCGLFSKKMNKKDVRVAAALSSLDGKIAAKATVWSDVPEVQALIDEADAHMMPMSGEFTSDAASNADAWIGAGVKGEWLHERLIDGAVKEILFMFERAVDPALMLKAVSGDMAMSVFHSFSPSPATLRLQARLDNTDFLSEVPYWRESGADYGLTMTETSEGCYVVRSGRDNVFEWGVRDNILTVANDFSLACDNGSSPVAKYADRIKGSRLFMWFGLRVGSPASPIVNWSNVAALTLRMASVREVEVEMEMVDEGVNALQQLFR